MGLAIAKILHSRGAKVSICDWSQESLDKAPGAIGVQKDDMLATKCDVRDVNQVRDWLKQTIDKFGQVDGAANFAGIIGQKPGKGMIEDQDEDDWDQIIGINLTGVMHSIKEEVKIMKPGSAIVNAASVAGIQALAGTTAYTVSKHGVVGLTRACAVDYGPKGIRINAVAPGYIATPMLVEVEASRGAALAESAAKMPIARKAEPEEVARVACFLLSDEASFVTGSIYSVDGGWHA